MTSVLAVVGLAIMESGTLDSCKELSEPVGFHTRDNKAATLPR